MEVKYPHVNVPLVGHDGNAFAIIGRVTRALRQANVPVAEIEAFRIEAFNGDYDHLLQTVMKTVGTDDDSDGHDE